MYNDQSDRIFCMSSGIVFEGKTDRVKGIINKINRKLSRKLKRDGFVTGMYVEKELDKAFGIYPGKIPNGYNLIKVTDLIEFDEPYTLYFPNEIDGIRMHGRLSYPCEPNLKDV